MTIKELAYSAQQHLQASTGSSLKRAHIYELLAASFGFKSYAALGVDAVFTQQRPDDERTASHNAFVRRRCIELGHSGESADLVSVTLGAFLAERQIGVVRISALIGHLRGDWSSPDDHPIGDDTERFGDEQNDGRALRWRDGDEGDFAPLMLDGLEAAASKGNALAHYALALIHAPDEEDADQKTGSSYWHSQAQQGRVLTGVEKEWADAYAGRLIQAERYSRHLREAGRLGNQHALLDLAERFGDPSFFEQSHHDVGADPSAVAEIAERLGRVADAKHWLTVAAESGDTDAMLRLKSSS
jgi:TPR repeat protein